jgi:hypothetical protein
MVCFAGYWLSSPRMTAIESIFCTFLDSGIVSSQNHEQVSIWIWLSTFWASHKPFFSDINTLCLLFGWHWRSEKIYFCVKNVESHHPMSKSIVSSAYSTEDQTISTDLMEIDPHISQSCVLSTESTDAQPISTHPVQPVEIYLFTVKSGLYAVLDSSVDALSSALLIVAVDFSRISALNRILPGHQYVQSGRYWLTLEDLTCPSHRFSELHH